MSADTDYYSEKIAEKEAKRHDAFERATEAEAGPESDRLFREINNIDRELSELRKKHRDAKVDELRGFAARPSTHEAGEDRGPVLLRRHGDPWAEARSGRVMNLSDVRSLALSAVERLPEVADDSRQRATRLVERADAEVADYIMRTSDPIYTDAFRVYLNHPMDYGARMSGEQRDAWLRVNETRAALTLSNGGAMVPTHLDATIMLTNAGSTNPFRQIARVVQINTDEWNGVTSAGVTAEWLAESAEAADATPTVSSATIPVHKAAAYIEASLEVTADSNLGDQIGRLISDAKDNLEATAFVTGSGSGQPTGLMTTLSVTTASRVAGSSGAAGAADLVAADVYALSSALPPRFRPNSSWLAENSIWNRVRQLAAGSSPQNANFWVDFGPATPSTLLGRPVYEASGVDSTLVSGSNDDVLILGDFRQGYVVVDRIGLSLLFEPLVKGANRRPVGNVGWFAYWRVGGETVVPEAFRYLRL